MKKGDATWSDLEKGDKVVVKKNKIIPRERFLTSKKIVCGIVLNLAYLGRIGHYATVRWIDYKGIVVFRSWIVYTKYLELYKP